MWKKYIPSIFTFSNLAFGVLSILSTFNKNYTLAAIFIICSALVDRYDGKIARKFSSTTQFGKELDSLADLVSFGTAPAVLYWSMFLINYNIIGYIICIMFPIAGAYRLARFNVMEFHNVYMGIPITIAGGLIALDALINIYGKPHYLISSVIMVILAYLMASSIKIKKF